MAATSSAKAAVVTAALLLFLVVARGTALPLATSTTAVLPTTNALVGASALAPLAEGNLTVVLAGSLYTFSRDGFKRGLSDLLFRSFNFTVDVPRITVFDESSVQAGIVVAHLRIDVSEWHEIYQTLVFSSRNGSLSTSGIGHELGIVSVETDLPQMAPPSTPVPPAPQVVGASESIPGGFRGWKVALLVICLLFIFLIAACVVWVRHQLQKETAEQEQNDASISGRQTSVSGDSSVPASRERTGFLSRFRAKSSATQESNADIDQKMHEDRAPPPSTAVAPADLQEAVQRESQPKLTGNKKRRARRKRPQQQRAADSSSDSKSELPAPGTERRRRPPRRGPGQKLPPIDGTDP